jgi:hypothetical protein
MASRFEHRATFSAPAGTVGSALVDQAFLTERLRVLGGKGAELVDHRASADEVVFTLHQGLDAQHLPGPVRAILKGGDLVVAREERWQLTGDRPVATGRASISGVPGEISSRTQLADLAEGASELVIKAEVRVRIPLIGGRIEGLVAKEVGNLLAAESEFADRWLAEHRGYHG